MPRAMVGGLFLSFLMLLLASCARGRPPEVPRENLLVVALENAPLQLDPRLGVDQASGRLYELVFNGLVTKDPDGTIGPDLAHRWEILEGGRRYRFHLRRGARFHDGRELAAADVVWTFQSILEGEVVTPKASAFDLVSRVEAVDPRTVDFVLRQPYGPLLVSLDSFTGIVPAGSTTRQLNQHPVGTGPFRLVERRTDRLILGAHDAYWDGRPVLDRVVLKVVPDTTVRGLELLKGSVHLVVNGLSPDLVQRFRRAPHFRVEEGPAASFSYLGLNFRDPVIADSRVRRALAHAIDRELLIRSLYRGLGILSETLLPLGHWARHEELQPIPHDVGAAKSLLEAAGHPDPDGDGPAMRLRISYKTSNDETALLQAQILQAQLAEAGIGIDIRSYEFATFFSDLAGGNFQIFGLRRFGVVDPDLYRLILHSQSVPPRGQNRGHYSNPTFDRLVEEGARRFTVQERRPSYLRVQEIFRRDLPYVLLFLGVNVAVLHRDLEGYQNYPNGELLSLRRIRWRSNRRGSNGTRRTREPLGSAPLRIP